MTKQETYIQFILDELGKGEVDKKTIFAKICEKFRMSSRTYDTAWTKAQKEHAERAKLARKEKDDQYVEQQKELSKSNIISKARRMEIASQIAEGILTDKDGKEPDFNARLKALDYLAKVEGDYAPVKNEHTGKNGEPIQTETAIKTTLKLS